MIDFTKNSFGEYLCKFLIDSNCCILNGRDCIKNDLTFVSTRGSCVVDYFIVPYENLEHFKTFQVHTYQSLTCATTINTEFCELFSLKRIYAKYKSCILSHIDGSFRT